MPRVDTEYAPGDPLAVPPRPDRPGKSRLPLGIALRGRPAGPRKALSCPWASTRSEIRGSAWKIREHAPSMVAAGGLLALIAHPDRDQQHRDRLAVLAGCVCGTVYRVRRGLGNGAERTAARGIAAGGMPTAL